jgi:hypothetical protein
MDTTLLNPKQSRIQNFTSCHEISMPVSQESKIHKGLSVAYYNSQFNVAILVILVHQSHLTVHRNFIL